MSAVDRSLAARGRFTVLLAHLATSIDGLELEAVPIIEPSCTSARNNVSPPGNLKGTLSVVDERTGRKYQVAVSEEGTVKATDLKKVRYTLFLIPRRSFPDFSDPTAPPRPPTKKKNDTYLFIDR